jgi:hypothetical protein
VNTNPSVHMLKRAAYDCVILINVTLSVSGNSCEQIEETPTHS